MRHLRGEQERQTIEGHSSGNKAVFQQHSLPSTFCGAVSNVCSVGYTLCYVWQRIQFF